MSINSPMFLVVILGLLFIALIIKINVSGKNRIIVLKEKHAKKLSKLPFSYIELNNLVLRYNGGLTNTYFNQHQITPTLCDFKDLRGGDFQETQYGLVACDGIKLYPTKSKALEVYKHFIHLGFFAITVDRSGRVDVDSLEMPDKKQVLVELGFKAYKELNEPTIKQLIGMYS